MKNSKLVFKYLRYTFFSGAIVLGSFLSIEEFIFSGSYRNLLIFLISSIFIFLIEVILLYGELFSPNNIHFENLSFNRRRSMLFNVIFLPIINIFLFVLLGISGAGNLSILIASLVLVFSLVSLFNYIDHNEKIVMVKTQYESFGVDIHKLIFIFLISTVMSNIFLSSNDTGLAFVLFILYFVILFLLMLTLNFYRRNSKNEIFIQSIVTSYITSLVLLIINLVFSTTAPVVLGFYVTIIFYSIIALMEIFYETNDLERSILGKYFSMILLATAILIFG